MEWKHLKAVLDEYGEYIAQQMKANLESDGSNASGELSNSITYVYEREGETLSVCISLLDYWKYLNYGTKPHFPPVNAIEKWIEVKRIVPQVRALPDGKTYLPTVRQLAFLIARSISEKGTEGTQFFDKAVESLRDRLMEAIDVAVAQDLEEEIDAVLASIYVK